MRKELMQEVTEAIENELEAANKQFRGFASTHEGYAVILEELEETKEEMQLIETSITNMWELTKADADKRVFRTVLEMADQTATSLVAEAIQTAAMIRKFKQFNERRV